jgi:Ca-activated chloride channel family protein
MNGWVPFTTALGVVLTAQLVTEAQQPTYRATTELVSLSVTVVDQRSEPVAGLTRDQFEVFENGVRQEVKFFAPGEMALDVAILLDASGSMAATMPLVQTAAIRLVNALRQDDRAAVMAISGGLRLIQAFTADKETIAAAIQGTSAAGRTPLYSAIYTALEELKKERRGYSAPRRQAIVMLSDGHDTASGFGFDELREEVRRQAVPIYTIAPRPTSTIKAQREMAFGESTHVQDFELRTLAAESGARAFFPVALHELADVYDDIAKELAFQYSLGYQPSHAGGEGEFRRVALRVAAPGVRWRTRTGYIAAPEAAAVNELR